MHEIYRLLAHVTDMGFASSNIAVDYLRIEKLKMSLAYKLMLAS